MKQRFRLLLSGGVVMAILVATPFVAAETSTANTNSQTSTNTTTSTEDDRSVTDMTTIKQHIEQEKAALKIKLTVAQQQKIVAKCLPAQDIVKVVLTRVDGAVTNRSKAYQELVDNLNKLSTKLKADNVDTTTLNQEISTLSTKITAYNTALAAYQQALTDVKTFDCKTDPTGFQAALQTARTKQQAVAAAAQDIRTYVTGTIKPTLQQIRTQLSSSTSSDSSTSTNSSTSGGNQ